MNFVLLICSVFIRAGCCSSSRPTLRIMVEVKLMGVDAIAFSFPEFLMRFFIDQHYVFNFKTTISVLFERVVVIN